MSKPVRLPDWKSRLGRYVAGQFNQPFRPGEFDCAIFAAGAVEAMTGIDFAARFKGRYTSVESGIEALRVAGHADHLALIAFIFDEVHPAFAQPGDIALLDGGDHAAIGIVQGEHIYALRGDGRGVGLAPRDAMQRAWRV
jgi:hypothetical protein